MDAKSPLRGSLLRANLQIAQEIWINLVPRRRLRGVRLAIDRFDRHALHQRRDVQTSSLDAFEGEQIAEHPAARERIIQVQLVYPAHNGKIGRRHGPGQRIDAAAQGCSTLYSESI